MAELYGPITRIILRYFAAVLVMIGAVGEDKLEAISVDPTLTMIVGGVLAVGVEFAYRQAKRVGGDT